MTPTISISEELLRRWQKRLAEENSTPILLVGMGHDRKAGQITCLTVEEIDDSYLLGILEFAINALKKKKRV